MTAQHTIGPWTYEFAPEPGHASEFRVFGPRQAELAYVGADEAHGVLGATVEANARVMAAAPDMAAVLLWIRENLHPKALGRGATAAELYAISHATMVLRQAGVIPTPDLIEADAS